MGDHLLASKKATYKAFKSFCNSNSYSSNSYSSIETSNTPFFSTSDFTSNQAPTSIDTTNSYPLLYNPKPKAIEGYNSKAKSSKGASYRGQGSSHTC